MVRKACNGNGLLEAFRAAVANLEAHVDEINSLNVYPVPDGDTGSNMLATVKSALDEAESVAGQSAERVAVSERGVDERRGDVDRARGARLAGAVHCHGVCCRVGGSFVTQSFVTRSLASQFTSRFES